jgi:DNA-binding MurR/RpiR family transcriptional regulator
VPFTPAPRATLPDDAPVRDYAGLVALLVARQGALSRRHAQVAQFFLNHPEDVAISTIVTLAAHAGVPPATITRFAQDLGFSGFPDLQRVFRERLLGPRTSFADRINDLRARPGDLSDADLDQPGRVFDVFVQAAVNSLLRIEDSLDRAALDRFVTVLEGVEAVHVAAARGAFSIGAHVFFGLAGVGKRAHLIDNLGAMRTSQIAAMGPRDALWVLTFDDYTPETVEIARAVHGSGRPVLAITDNELSPVAAMATEVLYVKEARLGHFRSQVPALVVAQAVIVALGRRIGQTAQADFQNPEDEKPLA